MDNLKILMPIIVALFTGLISQTSIFSNLFRRRKLKKIENANEFLKLFAEYDTEFKQQFILPDLKESYFYAQTGIDTNLKSIEKYIKLKDELSGNYTWKKIKSGESYLNLDGENIEVKINKFERFGANILMIVSLLSIVLSFLFYLFYGSDTISFTNRDSIIIFFLTLIPFVGGSVIAYSLNSIFVAKRIEKKLKKIRGN